MKTATADRPKDDDKWVTNVPKDEARHAIKHTSYAVEVGPPRATAFHTEEQLKQWGVVGIYKK